MEVGDLVWLDRRQFYEFNDHVGIILEVLSTPDGKLCKVAWEDNKTSWFHEEELEVINGK